MATCLLAGFAKLISSTLKMEAICSSETSLETQRTTRRHIPEYDTIHNHRCENLKFYKIKVILTTLEVTFSCEGLSKNKYIIFILYPLKMAFFLNNIYKSSLYLTGSTLRLGYKAQPVNAVWGNSRCLL
jgi:hypothetical protein